MRLLAEAFRFVGVIVVRNGDDTGPGIPVLPVTGMWYHCPDAGLLVPEKTDLLRLTSESSQYYVGLAPFKALPSSARFDELTLRAPDTHAAPAPILHNITLRPADDERPNRSLFLWAVPGGAAASVTPDVPIIGWSPEANLFDIITLPREPAEAGPLAGLIQRFTLSPVPWTEAPLAHRFNAVIRPDGAEAPLAEFSEVAPAWEDLL
jgi:hypothetical protein